MHNGCLLLHTQLPGKHNLHGRMYITFKYYPSAILTNFKGCIVNIIYHNGCKNMFSNLTSTLQEQPGFIQGVRRLMRNWLLVKSFQKLANALERLQKSRKRQGKSLCIKDSYHSKHNEAENRLLLILRNDFYYLCIL